MQRQIGQISPYVAAAIVTCITAGPWAYALGGSDADRLGLLGFGILLGCYYTYFTGWAAGAIFGITTILFLGPVVTLVSPIVTTAISCWFAIVICATFFSACFGFANALTRPGGKFVWDYLSAVTPAGAQRAGIQLVFIPWATVTLLKQRLDPSFDVPILLGMTLWLVVDWSTNRILKQIDPDLRPVMRFFRQLLRVLRAMWAGLMSFAIGYALTIIVFAGFYMALYKIEKSSFQLPGSKTALDIWDFIYFSVTTMTTVGLSELKPATDKFLPQALVSVELIVGMFWVVVYFAVAMSLLQVHAKSILEDPYDAPG